jgi:hypothetical protein
MTNNANHLPCSLGKRRSSIASITVSIPDRMIRKKYPAYMRYTATLLFLFAFLGASAQKAKAQQVLPAPVACQQFFSATGQPLAGGYLYTYVSGTYTPATTYTDGTGATANTNPIVLNAAGYPVSASGSCGIWLTVGTSYRFLLQDATHSQQWVVDNLPSSGVFALANTWTALQTFNGGITVPGTSTLGTVNTTSLFTLGTTNLNTTNIAGTLSLLSNPSSLTQDPLLTANYDNLFAYLESAKEYTTTQNSVGLMNMYQNNGAPTAGHGAYALYDVADFTALGGGLGVGLDVDSYFKDVSAGGNANVLPSVAVSATTLGSADFTSIVNGFQSVVVNDGTGNITTAADFLAPNDTDASTGTIAYDIGFYALDRKKLGTTLSAAFDAAPQTSCSTCWGFYSAPANNDQMGNLTITSLLINGGGVANLSGGLNASSTITGTTVKGTNAIALTNMLASSTTPTILSGFGTGASVTSGSNGTASFRVGVGTGGTASSGILTMPTATGGWNCYVGNLTAHVGNRADDTVMTASTTNSVTVQNQTKSSGAATAWTASDTLYFTCVAF